MPRVRIRSTVDFHLIDSALLLAPFPVGEGLDGVQQFVYEDLSENGQKIYALKVRAIHLRALAFVQLQDDNHSPIPGIFSELQTSLNRYLSLVWNDGPAALITSEEMLHMPAAFPLFSPPPTALAITMESGESVWILGSATAAPAASSIKRDPGASLCEYSISN